MIKGKTMNSRPLGQGIPCWDQAKEIEQLLQEIFRNGYFKDKNNRIQEDKDPCHLGESLVRDVIF